jgi:SPP1 gp7 family putative phage head morphogenesis protein
VRYDLAAIVRRAKNPRRKTVEVRPTIPTAALASNLYAATYKPIIARLESALPAILAAYERAIPTNDGLIRDAFTDDLQALFAALGEELQRIVLTLEPALREWSLNVERWQRGKFRGAILAATGIDIETLLLGSGTPQSVGDYINWNVALMKDVAAEGQARISQRVFSAFQGRLPARELASQIREAVGMSRQRSLRIASDQLSKMTAALDQERQTEAGIDRFKWRHSRKKHPRSYHVARDGKVYAWETRRQVGGDEVIAPGDLPGMAPFCGCRAQAVVVLG